MKTNKNTLLLEVTTKKEAKACQKRKLYGV